MEFLFAIAGLLVWILIDAGALNRSTATELKFIDTFMLYLPKRIGYILVSIILLLVVVYLKGNLPLVPDNLKIDGGDINGMAFIWGLAIQILLSQIGKFLSPFEVKV